MGRRRDGRVIVGHVIRVETQCRALIVDEASEKQLHLLPRVGDIEQMQPAVVQDLGQLWISGGQVLGTPAGIVVLVTDIARDGVCQPPGAFDNNNRYTVSDGVGDLLLRDLTTVGKNSNDWDTPHQGFNDGEHCRCFTTPVVAWYQDKMGVVALQVSIGVTAGLAGIVHNTFRTAADDPQAIHVGNLDG